MNVVELIENTETGANDRPVRPVVIADCGELVSEENLAESKGEESEMATEVSEAASS